MSRRCWVLGVIAVLMFSCFNVFAEDKITWQEADLKKLNGGWTTVRVEKMAQGKIRRLRIVLVFTDGNLEIRIKEFPSTRMDTYRISLHGVERTDDSGQNARILKLDRAVAYYDFVGDKLVMISRIPYRPFEGFRLTGEYDRLTDLAGPFAEDTEPVPPSFANVRYGPHERNVLDFWKAEGVSPRPLLVHIHGGGWVDGDKAQKPGAVLPYLDEGISVASINYRLTCKAPLPAPVHDAARAIQFLRTKAKDWNINTKRIALTGDNAGACTSMWLLLHDDLADPKATDPVLRESTRVCAAAVSAGQTSIDSKVIEGWLGPNVLKHRMIWMAVGEPTMSAALDHYDKHRAIYAEFSPYNHLDANDPPLFMTYPSDTTLPSKNAGHGIHHPVYGVKMKEKADQVGQECYLLIPGVSRSKKYTNAKKFLMAKLLAP